MIRLVTNMRLLSFAAPDFRLPCFMGTRHEMPQPLLEASDSLIAPALQVHPDP
ncbi:hypothetical protein N0K08_17910 [Acidovorax sp. Be4]|uniref:Uncharacterized protein n=1 Tax=Acidovorax bellezanensis TaxID=2976702 RepID=A0ABT2PPW3_9BURK|nr:hypothetical protein [Acidovorax sp. Be4]MCT9812514.1 hypothetical protein [Acidovorax sp. Be4]